MTAPAPPRAAPRFLTIAGRVFLVLFVVLVAHAAWRMSGGDSAWTFVRRIEHNVFWIVGAVPFLFMWFFTLVLGAILSGKGHGDGNVGGVDVGSSATHGDGSSFGSTGND